MENFRTSNGKLIEDVARYVGDWLNENREYLPTNLDDNSKLKPESEWETPIYIATNADGNSKMLNYTTSIVMRREGKGGHIIKGSQKVKFTDAFTKLYQEAQFSIDIAKKLVDEGIITANQVTIHMGYNPKPEFPSSQVNDTGLGLAKGMGFRVKSKPDSWAIQATKNA